MEAGLCESLRRLLRVAQALLAAVGHLTLAKEFGSLLCGVFREVVHLRIGEATPDGGDGVAGGRLGWKAGGFPHQGEIEIGTCPI